MNTKCPKMHRMYSSFGRFRTKLQIEIVPSKQISVAQWHVVQCTWFRQFFRLQAILDFWSYAGSAQFCIHKCALHPAVINPILRKRILDSVADVYQGWLPSWNPILLLSAPPASSSSKVFKSVFCQWKFNPFSSRFKLFYSEIMFWNKTVEKWMIEM